MKIQRFFIRLIATFSCVLLLNWGSLGATSFRSDNASVSQFITSSLAENARKFYEAGQVSEAIRVLEEAIADFEAKGNLSGQILALRNLALVYLRSRDLETAQAIIARSLDLAQTLQPSEENTKLLAQVLEIEGQVRFTAGDEEAALDSWTKAVDAYQESGDLQSATRNQLNQVQALQAKGLYNQAIQKLQVLVADLAQQPDSLTKAKALQSLGDVLRVLGKLSDSEDGTRKGAQSILLASLAIAQQLQSQEAIASILISLGNAARLVPDSTHTALNYYRQAAAQSPIPELKVQAQLNELSLLIDSESIAEAKSLVQLIQPSLQALETSRATIDARINFAQNLMQLPPEARSQVISPTQVADLLATAATTAQQLGDRRAEAYALGSLGKLYQQNQRPQEARQATERALAIAAAINAPDIAYQWQWQLGEIYQTEGNRQGAIAAYSRSVGNLQTIRSDLVAVSSDVQFSFRESVEPLYRDFVNLLLDPQDGSQPTQADLMQARDAIEALQLAELDNYFREACTDADPKQIDQVDAQTAVFYAVTLGDRLETILALPGEPLRHYSSTVDRGAVKDTIAQLRRIAGPSVRDTGARGLVEVRRIDPEFSPARLADISQRIYNWLITPAADDLQRSGVSTLVFVLDGPLRNLPIAALKNGDRYLLEDYALAISPGLQLLDPKPISRQQLSVLAGGLSSARSTFPALPNVEQELEDIQKTISSEVLFNEAFTEANFSKAARSSSAPIVHLATHGTFSSNPEKTYILTWDDTINPNELKTLIQADPRQNRPIELLVLSACQTAQGDDRAALGLAGVAVRAGARTTMASLWSVSDEATAQLMTYFYQEFANAEVTKAEALRRAQLQLLAQPEFQDPFYWAAFVLVGNWL